MDQETALQMAKDVGEIKGTMTGLKDAFERLEQMQDASNKNMTMMFRTHGKRLRSLEDYKTRVLAVASFVAAVFASVGSWLFKGDS